MGLLLNMNICKVRDNSNPATNELLNHFLKKMVCWNPSQGQISATFRILHSDPGSRDLKKTGI